MKLHPEIVEKLKIDLPVKIISGILILVITGLLAFFWSTIKPVLVNIHIEISQPILLPKFTPILGFTIGVLSYFVYSVVKDYFLWDYTDYRKGKYLGIIWKWDYTARRDVSVLSMEAICPKCNTRMDMYEFGNEDNINTGFMCNNRGCEYNDLRYVPNLAYSKDEIKLQISRLIDRDLRNWGLKL